MRSSRIVWSLVLGCCLFPQLGAAETLPTSGTFDDYYHRDHYGVGHFGFFLVSPDLHDKLAKFADRRIRLEVTKAEQPFNPGPAIILAIGQIEELPPLDVRLTVKTRPSPVIAGQAFEVILQISDTRAVQPGESPALLRPDHVLVSFRQPVAEPGLDADKPSPWFNGYTMRQLAVNSDSGHLGPFAAGWPNLLASKGPIELLPGDSWAWIVSFRAGVAKADGEVQTVGSCLIAPDESRPRKSMPFEVWHDVAVHPAEPASGPLAAPDKANLRLEDITLIPHGNGGWSNLRFKLLPVGDSKIRVPGAVNTDSKADHDTYGKVDRRDTNAGIGRLDAFQADGTPVELEVRRIPDAVHVNTLRSQLVELPQRGAVVAACFRKTSRFAPDVARLSVSFVTEAGVETLAVSDHYQDPDVSPATSFGAATSGVKLRVRPATPTFKAGAALTFYAQAVNNSGSPIYWRKPSGGCGENLVVEIDGAVVRLPAAKAEFIGGWAIKATTINPVEWTVELPTAIRFAQGRHTLRYTIVSRGGSQMNANNVPVPVLNGRIVSNEVTFSVE